jgi:hypothetical protein
MASAMPEIGGENHGFSPACRQAGLRLQGLDAEGNSAAESKEKNFSLTSPFIERLKAVLWYIAARDGLTAARDRN